MNKAEALNASIEAWEAKRDAEIPRDVFLGPGACPLCQLFCKPKPGIYCTGCPVYEQVKQHGCAGTPYIDAIKAHDDWCEVVWSPDPDPEELALAQAAWVRAAQREIDFLKSLKES